jgi:hypothetical protein
MAKSHHRCMNDLQKQYDRLHVEYIKLESDDDQFKNGRVYYSDFFNL